MGDIPVSLLFDMRAPAFGAPIRELYASVLDMAAFGDEIGVARINLMEHHGSEDGYLPVPFVLGGGVAARTKKCQLTIGAVILPFHDPVKVAEQISVLDIMSNGRLRVVIGAGYVAQEFAAFEVSLKDRAKLLDKGIDIILRALNGERFEVDGRPIFVRPLPLQKPEDIVIVGGGVEASARRAARFNLGFSPIKRDLLAVYDVECRKLGREPKEKTAPGVVDIISYHISNDPDATWSKIEPHALHAVNAYIKLASQDGDTSSMYQRLSAADLRAMGLIAVVTPDEFVKRAEHTPDYSGMSICPLLGGLSPEIGWETLHHLKTLMPRIDDLNRQRRAAKGG
jgi:alkanesulfonate monooxygenase SsuD/methylene tetrahydromethanopterin reductase-like flavin-dependent oxidoreductase (luciferase family)